MNYFFEKVRIFLLHILGKDVRIPFEEGFPNIFRNKKVITKWVNSTPFFIIDRFIVQKQLNNLQNALQLYWGKNAIIAYSFKTNNALAHARILKQEHVWAEVVSSKEYAYAKKLGYSGNTIIFNGPMKRDTDIMQAIKNNSIIHIDNFDELARVIRLTTPLRQKISIGIRIHGIIDGMQESRFGFSIERNHALSAIKLIQKVKYLRVHSLHMHIGTDIDALDAYKQAAKIMGNFTNTIERQLGYAISYLDMGGGFPSLALKPFSREDWNPQPVEKYIQVIAKGLQQTLNDNKNKHLIIEPGRYLVDDAVAFISTVHSQKIEDRVQKIITDGAVTMLPLRHYRPQIVKVFDRGLTPRLEGNLYTFIYGGSCKEDDVLYEGRLPKIELGDYVVYYCVGAYNQSMGSDFIFGTPSMHMV